MRAASMTAFIALLWVQGAFSMKFPWPLGKGSQASGSGGPSLTTGRERDGPSALAPSVDMSAGFGTRFGRAAGQGRLPEMDSSSPLPDDIEAGSRAHRPSLAGPTAAGVQDLADSYMSPDPVDRDGSTGASPAVRPRTMEGDLERLAQDWVSGRSQGSGSKQPVEKLQRKIDELIEAYLPPPLQLPALGLAPRRWA